MRYLLLAMTLSSSLAFGADYKLTDPSILGEYRLTRANKKSELQVAQIRYNVDNKLVLLLDRQEQELELDGPNKNGVIYEGSDEPNCGSGDEGSCLYDASTKVTLESVEVRGEWIPQLTIEISEVDAYNDNDSGTDYKWVLNWAKAIPDAVPYYISAEIPANLKRIVESCKKKMGNEYVASGMDVCGFVQSYTYRGSETRAVNKFIKDNARDTKKMKQVSEKMLTGKIFPRVDAWIASLPQEDLKVKKAEVLAQSKKVQNWVLENCDKIYFEQWNNDGRFICVNTDETMITSLSIRNKK